MNLSNTKHGIPQEVNFRTECLLENRPSLCSYCDSTKYHEYNIRCRIYKRIFMFSFKVHNYNRLHIQRTVRYHKTREQKLWNNNNWGAVTIVLCNCSFTEQFSYFTIFFKLHFYCQQSRSTEKSYIRFFFVLSFVDKVTTKKFRISNRSLEIESVSSNNSFYFYFSNFVFSLFREHTALFVQFI